MRQPLVSNLISGILNALYPSTCPSCSRRTDNLPFSPFCLSCWSLIERYSGAACSICADPLSSSLSRTCAGCIKDPPPFSRAISFGIYDEVLATAIHALKFRRIKRLHKPLGTLLFQLEIDLCGIDAIVPVPMSPRDLRARGFNQSLLLAKILASETKTPLIIDGLIKKKDTPQQIGLTAKERTANLRGAFSAKKGFKGMTVLLVDDVMTTGATARACSKQLRKAGAGNVVVCALARAAST
jgi:ComF family protein